MRFLLKFVSDNYRRFLSQPVTVLMGIIVICVLAGHYSQQFTFDASADSLVVEGDPELTYYRKINEHFGGEEFLFLTYTPIKGDLLSPEVVPNLVSLSAKLAAIKGVRSVTSILDAPLMKSPPIPLSQLADNYLTIKSPGVDLKLAYQELTTSPLFKNMVISADGRTTAFRIDLVQNTELNELREKRDALRAIEKPNDVQQDELDKVNNLYRVSNERYLLMRDNMLFEIRKVRDSISNEAISHLGGVPMVASDMIEYVKGDIVVFGSTVLLLTTIMLFAFFRRIRWVLIPLATTAVTILLTIGILGFFRQSATVISSNFISLLSIISISFSIHLVSQYRELMKKNSGMSHCDLVFETMMRKLEPCVYTALTTTVAFASLTTSDILPVMDFGWIMCVGVFVSLIVTYTFFASVLILLPKGKVLHAVEREPVFIHFLCYLSIKRARQVLISALVLVVVGVVGLSQLSLDSRFIDYFRSDTEVHAGLSYIDTNFGGTIPLDIVIDFPPYIAEELDDDDDFFFSDEEEDSYPERYWFTQDKIEYLEKFTQYLKSRSEIGKIISLATLEEVARDFNEGKPLNSVEIVAILSALPEKVRNDLIAPYASPEAGMMRISTRVHETGPFFSRDKLIQDIKAFAVQDMGLEPSRVHVTGMTVLFNDMLKQLFASQASTLIFVVGATFLMFLILLRSFSLAVIGLAPNILAATTILAFMGFAGIPLDMMTITIAAIIIGIGVDDAIHYLHRFQEEYEKTNDVVDSVKRSHNSIGYALYFTSLTVIIGFSVLSFSSFIPTVYFGLLTALAMILALLANLTILPSLLVKFYR